MSQFSGFRILARLILVVVTIAFIFCIPAKAIAATRHPVIPAHGEPILGGNMHGADWIAASNDCDDSQP